jgi:hypothetical protein
MTIDSDNIEINAKQLIRLIWNHIYLIMILLIVTYTLVFLWNKNQDIIYESEINISTQTFDIFDASLNTATLSSYNLGNNEMYNKKIFFEAYRDALFERENIIAALRVFYSKKNIETSDDSLLVESKFILKGLKSWDYTREDNMIFNFKTKDLELSNFFLVWYVPFVVETIKTEWLGLVKNGLLLSNNVEQIELENEIYIKEMKIERIKSNLKIEREKVLKELYFNLKIAEKLNIIDIQLPQTTFIQEQSSVMFEADTTNHYEPYSHGSIPLYFFGTTLLNEEIAIVNSKDSISSGLEAHTFNLAQLKQKIDLHKKIALDIGISEPEFQYASPGALTIYATIQDVLKSRSVVNYNLELIRYGKNKSSLTTLIFLSTFGIIFVSIILILLRWKFFSYRIE